MYRIVWTPFGSQLAFKRNLKIRERLKLTQPFHLPSFLEIYIEGASTVRGNIELKTFDFHLQERSRGGAKNPPKGSAHEMSNGKLIEIKYISYV